ncbi:1-acyl-sn-glycerol-3-phosphate acyltransferase [Phytoactinopolyspora mesophila]|uniref:1-acyl-sn-glycerol-3-phosphate acyltransferase n=1 Tax=Phytoactinopolyspora mesophila TaxID=2650750 RepID=A0A7K3M1Z5_9ACTN|nr:1-acyl-sn-glycerol-3-phosphate acyltransferase [Phytoactinopolyspora mesophila]
MLYWLLKKVLLGPLLRVYYRPWAEGTENVPTEGPAILAGNHLTVVDSFFMPLLLPRKVTFWAKSDYFTETGVKGWFKRFFFSRTGNLPVDRSGGRASEQAMRSALKVLEEGELLGLYPEGTRSPDGRLYRGKTGAARLALAAKVPVIPVAMIGTAEMQPAGQLIPKRMRPGVRFGKPLDFSRYEGLEADRYVLRAVTDEIMYALMELSGQEYVDAYAASVKAKLAAEQRDKKSPGDD